MFIFHFSTYSMQTHVIDARLTRVKHACGTMAIRAQAAVAMMRLYRPPWALARADFSTVSPTMHRLLLAHKSSRHK